MYWRYNKKKKHPIIDQIKDFEIPIIVSPSIMDYNHLFPSFTKGEKNIINLIKYGYQQGVIGEITSSWGDYRNKELRENRIYGFILSGEVGWNPSLELDLNNTWKGIILHFFGRYDSRIQNIFDIYRGIADKKLLNVWQSLYYNHFFSHPYAKNTKRYRKTRKTKNFMELIPQLEEIIKGCEDLYESIPRNQVNIRYLSFVAKHYKFYCKKRLNAQLLTGFDPKIVNINLQKGMIKKIQSLKEELRELFEEYQELWLKCAREDCFETLKQRYLWLEKFYDDKIAQIHNNIVWKNPNIPSETIYLNHDKIHETHTTYYKKIITLDEDIKNAHLQIIAGTFAKIFINGEYLGYVITRHTLNYVILENNIKIFNLKGFLHKGKNLIAIENKDYTGGVAPLNIYGKIEFKSGQTREIYTNKDWHATRELKENWNNKYLFEESWERVKSFGSPPRATGTLTYPDFRTNLKSMHSDLVVFLNQVTSSIPNWLWFLLKFAIKFVDKHDIIE